MPLYTLLYLHIFTLFYTFVLHFTPFHTISHLFTPFHTFSHHSHTISTHFSHISHLSHHFHTFSHRFTHFHTFFHTLTSAVLIAQVRETPYIPEPDCVADTRKEKLQLAPPRASFSFGLFKVVIVVVQRSVVTVLFAVIQGCVLIIEVFEWSAVEL